MLADSRTSIRSESIARFVPSNWTTTFSRVRSSPEEQGQGKERETRKPDK